jgi:hypothetical protein
LRAFYWLLVEVAQLLPWGYWTILLAELSDMEEPKAKGLVPLSLSGLCDHMVRILQLVVYQFEVLIKSM